MIKINNLSKSFDNKSILKNINFNIESGTIVGLVGVNGAGKSTLIRSIMGIYSPDNGSILIEDKDVLKFPEIKEFIGYVADKSDYFNKLKIKGGLK